MNRFASKEEMESLLTLCRQGKLFEVQKWIADGNPVNPPPPVPTRKQIHGPLEVSIGTGFHSLVQVLLAGGANTFEPHHNGYNNFCAINVAVRLRRLDLIELLVEYGANIHDVPLWMVFNTWDPSIMRYFVEHGADMETDDPVAYAFKSKIRTALGVYKEYEERFPDWKRQLNIALRFHAKEQNQKWVSLMLWAGADPFEPGPKIPKVEEIDYYDRCAVEIALSQGWGWMLEKIGTMNPTEENIVRFLGAAAESRTPAALKPLIDVGFLARLTAVQKSALIERILQAIGSDLLIKEVQYGKQSNRYLSEQNACFSDGTLELLLRNGVKWMPDVAEIKTTRQRLMRMGGPGFSAFVRLLKKNRAATEEIIHELTRTGAAQRLLNS